VSRGRTRYASSLGAAVALSWACSGCSHHGNGTPVVLVSIDTLRPDHLGAYGYPRPTSPHIDAFRRDSILFRTAIAQAPSTLPSHASMMTSLLPPHHSASVANNRALPPEVATLAELVRKEGYATASFNGGVQLQSVWGLDRGFDTYVSVRPRNTPSDSLSSPDDRFAHVLDLARGWIREHRARPFFLFLHTYEVHHPYTPDAQDLAPFRGDYHGPLPDDISVELLREINDRHRPVDARDRQHIVDAYDGEIRSMDRAFGALVDVLRSNGIYDRALVVFTSDHGEEFGEHGKMGRHSHTLFDELLRVPLIVKLPHSQRAGSTESAEAQGIDLAPTVLGALGLPEPRAFEGRDLLRPPPRDPPPSLSFRDVVEPNASAAIRTPEWKLYDRSLFHLATDPGEKHDVAKDNVDVFRALRERMKEIASSRPAPRARTAAPDEDLRERLRSLGYVE
jgi:arylsulfatase A-like enzyme